VAGHVLRLPSTSFTILNVTTVGQSLRFDQLAKGLILDVQQRLEATHVPAPLRAVTAKTRARGALLGRFKFLPPNERF
jgi:hypothetical protein